MKAPGTSIAQVTAQWQGGFSGSGIVKADDFMTSTSLPSDFGGRGEGATPEDLLLSALASCYLITLSIILEKHNISYTGLSISAKLETSTAFPPKIKTAYLQPLIVTDADELMVRGLAERAEALCVISQAISGNVVKKIDVCIARCDESDPLGAVIGPDIFREGPAHHRNDCSSI